MQKIHDSGYKWLFSNKTIFRQLIETFVDQEWVKQLDFSDCERIDKSFLSEHYKSTESDLIYKLKLHGEDFYIYILLEFQSTVYRFMALRVLNYLTNFYMDYVETQKGVRKLPPIFPIVLYNGDHRWTAPLNMTDLIEGNPSLGKFGINFEYFKIAENEYTKRDLLKIRNIVSTLFLAESHYDIELLIDEFISIFEKEEDKQAISTFLNWFKQLAENRKIESSDYHELERVYKNTGEVKEMLIKALERERSEIYRKGEEKGIERGIEKGIEKGIERGIKTGIEKGKKEERELQRKIFAKAMLIDGEPIEKIARYTSLSVEEINILKAELDKSA